jgi:hypothetical protein
LANLFANFRSKIFRSLSDNFSVPTARGLCGKEDQLELGDNPSETGHYAHGSFS